MKSIFALVAVATVALVALPAAVAAQSLAGLWDATVTISNGTIEIPFRFEISTSGSTVSGSFFNGDERVKSTTGRFDDGKLVLAYDEYGTTIEATLKDGALEGQYLRGTRGAPYPFKARRFVPATIGEANALPAIAGLWNVQVGKSSKGEAAWQLIVRQSGPEVSAAILRIDGDTGALTGSFHEGKFVLSHFSGARPLRLELTPGADGSLQVVQNVDKLVDRDTCRTGARERPAAAERSLALHQRRRSDRALPLLVPRC